MKSAFKMIQELKGEWSPNDNSGFWRRLWNLKIPHKVRNFLWRACNDYIPTRASLLSKRVSVSYYCPLCNRGVETTLHCLVTCDFAQWCLQILGLGNIMHGNVNFAGWFEHVMGQYSNGMISNIGMLLWSIWNARNSVVWQGTYMHVDEVIRVARSTLDQWLEAQKKNFIPSVVTVYAMEGSELWTKPVGETIKINVDAALFNEDNRYGYACVARDYTGRLVTAKTGSWRGKVAPELAEAVAFKEALSWIKAKGWQSIVVESDCIKVVQALRSSLVISSPFGLIISDCKQLINDIGNAAFYFVKRSANGVAHCLARLSILFPDRTFTEMDVPFEVLSLCMAEALNE